MCAIDHIRTWDGQVCFGSGDFEGGDTPIFDDGCGCGGGGGCSGGGGGEDG